MDTSRIKNERLLAANVKMEQRMTAIESAFQVLLEKLLDLEDEVRIKKGKEKEIKSVEDVFHEEESKIDQPEIDEEAGEIKPSPEETPLSRDELKQKASVLGVEFQNNIPTDKLIILINEKQGE